MLDPHHIHKFFWGRLTILLSFFPFDQVSSFREEDDAGSRGQMTQRDDHRPHGLSNLVNKKKAIYNVSENKISQTYKNIFFLFYYK
jgi:hypothetical protein